MAMDLTSPHMSTHLYDHGSDHTPYVYSPVWPWTWPHPIGLLTCMTMDLTTPHIFTHLYDHGSDHTPYVYSPVWPWTWPHPIGLLTCMTMDLTTPHIFTHLCDHGSDQIPYVHSSQPWIWPNPNITNKLIYLLYRFFHYATLNGFGVLSPPGRAGGLRQAKSALAL